MLFEGARHEPLVDAAWSADRAQAAIHGIVESAQAALAPGVTWPWHPLDNKNAADPPHKSLYLGSAGTLWALWYLEREGAARLGFDPAAVIERVYALYLEQPDTGKVVPSYFLGEAGLLTVLWRLTGARASADRLHASIRENIPNPVNEALWAAPGTVVGALHMLDWTGETRWKELFLENVEHIWSLWQPSPHAACHLWTQDLYGEIVQLIGAGHGFAGNVYPLLRGSALLTEGRRELLYDRCVEALSVAALHEGGSANWPASVGKPREGRDPPLVQWCHGAPGIVTGLARFPKGHSSRLEQLLVQGGDTIWKAGPLTKGPGLCHGTGGNGYAFLELHRRTGDSLWLDRARAFAMHALGQSERMRRQYGQGRHGLWTGDPGLAIYLWHCMKGSGGLPSLEVL